jgi:hemerythrin superfamily protein
MADALDLLHADHQSVTELYAQLGETGDAGARRALVDAIVHALSAHAALEEEVFYPAVADRVVDGGGFVEASLADHRSAQRLIERLASLAPRDPDFDPTVGRLMKEVRTHVNGEELQLFPRVRQALSAAEIEALGERLARRRDLMPAPAPRPATPARTRAPRRRRS